MIPIAIIPSSFGTDSPVDCTRDSCHTYTDVTYPRHYFPYLELAIRPGAHSSYAHETRADKDDLCRCRDSCREVCEAQAPIASSGSTHYRTHAALTTLTTKDTQSDLESIVRVCR